MLNLSADEQRTADTPGRRSNDVSTDGMPWQVRAVALIGVPAALCCFLVWILAGRTTDALERIESIVKPHAEAAAQLGLTLQQLERDHRDSNARIEAYMRLMCVQSAKTPAERNGCLGVR